MMLEYFQNLESGIAARIKQEADRPNARKKYALEVARLGTRLYEGTHSVAWCGIVAPFDLLNAMGLTSCFVEFVGAMLASTGAVEAFLEEAEQAGYATDACGYHRSVIGAAQQGVMPVPDVLVATTVPCTGGLAVMENLARRFNKPLFVLNVPQQDDDEAVDYLAAQMRAMVDFITRHTGKTLDKDRLARAVELSNQAREIMGEVYRLARRVPSPNNGRLLNNFGIVMPLFFGTEAAVDIARAYRREFAERIESGQPGVPGEQLRLLWIQNRIQFKNPVVEMLEKDYRANIVADELNSVTWGPIDPGDPLRGMARRSISIPFNGEVNRRIRHLQQMAKDFRLHGAINPCHWGCRQGTGARGLIAAGLKEIGVPVLNLEVDCVDTRNFAEGQLRTRLEAFLEMLAAKGSPWSN